MTTHNLKDLAYPKVVLEPMLVGSWKPGNRHVSVTNFTTQPVAPAVRQEIKDKYRETIQLNRKFVDEKFTNLYGKPLYFRDKVTSALVFRIKEVEAMTGKSLEEIANVFHIYMSKKCSFFRKENDKLVAIDSTKILEAYNQIKSNSPIEVIEQILYN